MPEIEPPGFSAYWEQHGVKAGPTTALIAESYRQVAMQAWAAAYARGVADGYQTADNKSNVSASDRQNFIVEFID